MRRGQHGRVKLRIRASPDSPLTSSSLGSCSRLVDSDGEVTEVRRTANCAPTDVDSESAHGSNTLSGFVSFVKVKRTTLLLWRPLLQRVVRVHVSVIHRLVKAFRRRGWKVKKYGTQCRAAEQRCGSRRHLKLVYFLHCSYSDRWGA